MSLPLDRSFDACINRAAEGLRVLMDVVRFELNESTLSERLKDLRHRLVQVSHPSNQCHLLSRESQADVSRPSVQSNLPKPYPDLHSLVEANSRRAQEALRSLEELSRVVDLNWARGYELIRYEVYDLHKEIANRVADLAVVQKMDFELYVVTDEKLSMGRPLTEVVRKSIKGGAGCIQLREKNANKREVLSQAKELRHLTREEGVTFIVNDHIDIALETEADGVHLGQEDLPLVNARRLTRGSLLIGVSTHNNEQALEAQEGGAGYINIGPIFPTETKGVPVSPVTPKLIEKIAPRLMIPFTTMGGIHLENVREVVLAGADRVAVVSEVVSANDIEVAARKMVEAVRVAKAERNESTKQDS